MEDLFVITGNFKAGGKNFKPAGPNEAPKTITGLDEATRELLLKKGRITPYQKPAEPLAPEQLNVNQPETQVTEQPPVQTPPAAPVAPAPTDVPVAPQSPQSQTVAPVAPDPGQPTASQIANDPDLQ